MQMAGQTSWRIEIDQSEPLATGLYVRDAAALHSELTWLPPVFPEVTGSAARVPEEAGRQWDTWWETSWARAFSREATQGDPSQPTMPMSWWTPPDFDALAGLPALPALQAVVARHFADASAWAQARKREHVRTVLHPDRGLIETTLVADLEDAGARRARPFRLRITEIPIAGQHLWQPQPDHVLLSAALLQDTAEYRRRLAPVVQALL